MSNLIWWGDFIDGMNQRLTQMSGDADPSKWPDSPYRHKYEEIRNTYVDLVDSEI